jgi:predicted secreted protein
LIIINQGREMHRRLVLMIIGILCLSMFSFLHLAHACASTSSEAPAIQWSKRYGTTRSLSGGSSIVQTTDGGYAIASTSDFGTGNDADERFWLIKTDFAGNAKWNKTYGDQREVANDVVQTRDRGFAIVGNSYISGYGNTWLVKTDPSGNMQWNKSYTELGWATAYAIIQTKDGGYVIAGDKQYYQAWLMKTDADGAIQWSRSFGGYNSALYSVIHTSDGGYAATGNIQDPSSGKIDAYIVKTDSEGNIIWSNEFSRTTGDDYGRAIIQTSDGGYAIAGLTNYWGNADFWLIKTNASGSFLWDKTYGGAGWDGASSIVQTSDGGYLLAGQTTSFGAGGFDLWLVKTDSDGNMQWNQTYGGAGNDVTGDSGLGHSLIRTIDQGYALVGYTNSFTSDASYQVWLIKLASRRENSR